MHTRPTVDFGFFEHCQDLKEVCLCQRTKQMTFWEIGVGLWSMAHFGYNSGGSRGGAWGARVPLLFLDPTEAQRAEKIFLETTPPLSQGLVDQARPPPPPLI